MTTTFELRTRPRRIALACLSIAASIVLACGDRDAPGRPPDVVMLVVDTLRADHMGLHGYPRETTPALDRFADGVIVFENVFSTSSWTLPAVASLLTGAYPSNHGLRAREGRRNIVSLGPSFSTLAQVLRARGYRTVAIVTNPWVSNPKQELDRGFETFLSRPMETRAEQVNAMARAQLESDDPRPLFLYLHYMDVHGPYRLPGPDDPQLSPSSSAIRERGALTRKERRRLPGYLKLEGAHRLLDYVDAYDIGIRRWDDAFGRLVGWLEQTGRLEKMLLTVVADHGEELLDHGDWNHGETLYQDQLHVPWILHAPKVSPRRVAAPVSLVDVAPTLLQILGLQPPSTMAGGLDALSPRALDPRDLYAETDVRRGGREDKRFGQLALRRGNRKWLIGRRSRACYDLALDPAEAEPQTPGGDCDPEGFSALHRWADEERKAAEAMEPGRVQELSEQERAQLEELGYLE